MYLDLTLAIDMHDPVISKANQDQNSYMSQGHIGTHLDVYEGQSRPPAAYCLRPGLVIDVGHVGDTEITPAVLRGRNVNEGDFVIFRTGYLHERAYGTRDYFQGHPQLSWDFIDLLATLKLSFIGLDFAGLRRGEEHGEADRRIGVAGAYIIENMANVDELCTAAGEKRFDMITGWTGFAGVSGLSCRVVANLNALMLEGE